ncbi:25629_t:CDS:1, partial [Gigaspora rosea]
ATKKQTINPLKEVNRFWEPCIIYIYSDTGTGKSNFCKELLPGIYQKDDIKQFENYNNDEFDYKRDTAILFDDFYRSNISWTNFLQLTDENYCLIDVKYGKTKIVAMYICITSNGPIENLYKNLRERNSSIDIKAFIRRVRFIIKFEGDPIDSRIGKGNVIRIFEKGNKQDFNNRIFDIEFNKETTLEQAEKVTIDLGIKETTFQDTVTGYYYWRQSWKNEINKYSTIENIDDITDRIITNIPKSDPGKRIIVSSSKDKKHKI